MLIEDMVKRKKELGYSYKKISELSGIPVGTVQKILGGFTKNPRYETLLKLDEVLSGIDYSAATYRYVTNSGASNVGERVLDFTTKRQGEYTLEDYYKIPDERRVELIDGVIYDMGAPTIKHQHVAGEIYHMLKTYVDRKGGDCLPFIAPYDCQLDKDDDTMMEPDVFIVCDRSKITNAHLFGAPDFIVEVLSPSTRKKDMEVKLNKYRDAKVREYWMIDIDKEKVIVYLFGEDPDINIYGFGDQIPVSIYEDCYIDFPKIAEGLKLFQE